MQASVAQYSSDGTNLPQSAQMIMLFLCSFPILEVTDDKETDDEESEEERSTPRMLEIRLLNAPQNIRIELSLNRDKREASLKLKWEAEHTRFE